MTRSRRAASGPKPSRRSGGGRVRFEHSAGGVVVRRTDAEVEVALASRRTARGDLAWGLPKGLVEEGERPEQAAEREVREETGLVAEIRASLGDISYWYVWSGQRISKKVSFFLMEAVGGDVSLHDHEMEEVRWFPASDAVKTASYRGEQEVIGRALETLASGPGAQTGSDSTPN